MHAPLPLVLMNQRNRPTTQTECRRAATRGCMRCRTCGSRRPCGELMPGCTPTQPGQGYEHTLSVTHSRTYATHALRQVTRNKEAYIHAGAERETRNALVCAREQGHGVLQGTTQRPCRPRVARMEADSLRQRRGQGHKPLCGPTADITRIPVQRGVGRPC